jgi:hypothetical protein
MSAVRTIFGSLVWLAVVVVIALGAAGIATGLDQAPGTDGRAELTMSGDAEVTPRLDAIDADLSDLADQVGALGTQARGALASLNGADADTAQTAISTGDLLVADIVRRVAAIRTKLATVPYVGSPQAGLSVSQPVVDRYQALESALAATDGLDFAWARLSISAIAASKMSELLAEHDRLMGEAAAKGRDRKYADAQKLIDRAAAQLTTAKSVRDDLAKTVEVSVLDEWIKRNADYDTALRNLYKAIARIGKTVTPAVRNAAKAEKAARANLPPDPRALVVIMADIGRGGMNEAVIGIEEARATLSDAIDEAASGAAGGSPGPSGSPAP